ncbi:hypothetical protein HNQ59_003871 [Chitinivorax tropicus]|uniref:Right-handed parallel beta-helix repeat-containing protein n=1 Tax=Chitinivorax tropicus TaxID=714531 RepID=A0A840MQ35_9PROT|nr:choice-of-anchor Q domain-containing protein [Chitinivorax tropicus]MBB5020550.1 hypothetical protein [Chitinivorax tropicus]
MTNQQASRRISSISLLAALALSCIQAQARTYIVTSANDTGEGTLRAILETAPLDPFGDQIFFNLPPHQRTIDLTSGELIIDRLVKIDGGEAGIKLSGLQQHRVIRVTRRGVATLNNLTIEKGYLSGQADDTSFPLAGAGILNAGHLTLQRVTLQDNHLRIHPGPSPTSSAQADDTARHNGGGAIANASSGSVLLLDSLIWKNTIDVITGDGGAMLNEGQLVVQNSTFTENWLIGVSGHGGALSNQGIAALINSTVGENGVSYSSQGYNTGAGIYNSQAGKLSVSYSTIANNRRGQVSGNPTLDQQSLDNHGGQVWLTHTAYPLGDPSHFNDFHYNYLGPDARLSSLGMYGGLTPTYLPLADSPLIDNGQPNCNLLQDQRRQPRTPDGRCDIGAVEVK